MCEWPELRAASYPLLMGLWHQIAAERFGLAADTACVEPPGLAEDIRVTVEADYQAVRAELHRRRHLLDGVPLADLGDDGAMLALYPAP